MAKKAKVVRVSEEELALLEKFREQQGQAAVEGTEESTSTTVGLDVLTTALTQAIQATKPKEKKTVATRTKRSPWDPKDGSPKKKLKRTMYHHGIPIRNIDNDEIELLNKLRPGRYCNGYVVVTLRKDRGIDIDYPVKTASQRLRLPNEFGITSFRGLLQRLVDEAADPKKYRRPEDNDLYELES